MTNSETMRLPHLFVSKKHRHTSDNTILRKVPPISPAERIANEIVLLFEIHGAGSNDGEPVSQASHMVQCAMLAMTSQNSLSVIIGALLHDIGHLIKQEQSTEALDTSSLVNLESLGGAYLRAKGFSEHVCILAEQQAAGMRYLAATDEIYKKNLSSASLQTLNKQGGPMSASEIAAFEKQTYFKDIINVSRWNEETKNPKAVLLPVTWFRKLIWDHLYYRVA